ncbi:MAG: serine protease, partial [Acidobacteria bacterium]|nr:serine protease [Acidobacteriota bacterium]
MSEDYLKAPFDPEGFYPALALIRTPHHPQAVNPQPGPDDYFGTGLFAAEGGTLFTVAHNLTEDGFPDGKLLRWVWVCCYSAATRDWTDSHLVEVDPNLIEPKLDAAILLAPTRAPATFRLAADWRLGDSVVVLGFQPDSSRLSGFAARHLFCEIPTNWPVAPFDLKEIHGEPVLRLGMTFRSQQPLGRGISGSPVLNRRCAGSPAIAIEKAIEWSNPDELRPPEVKTTALCWLSEVIARLPVMQQPALPPKCGKKSGLYWLAVKIGSLLIGLLVVVSLLLLWQQQE